MHYRHSKKWCWKKTRRKSSAKGLSDFRFTQSNRINTETFRLNLKGIGRFDLCLANPVFVYEFTSLKLERDSVNFWNNFQMISTVCLRQTIHKYSYVQPLENTYTVFFKSMYQHTKFSALNFKGTFFQTATFVGCFVYFLRYKSFNFYLITFHVFSSSKKKLNKNVFSKWIQCLSSKIIYKSHWWFPFGSYEFRRLNEANVYAIWYIFSFYFHKKPLSKAKYIEKK